MMVEVVEEVRERRVVGEEHQYFALFYHQSFRVGQYIDCLNWDQEIEFSALSLKFHLDFLLEIEIIFSLYLI